MADNHSTNFVEPILNPPSEDRISSLPDDVLHLILTRLSLKEAVSTSVLAHRWRRCWCTNPFVSLDFSLKISNDPEVYAAIVNSCLAACASNQSVESMYFHIGSELDNMVFHRWIDFAKEKSIKSLSLFFHGSLDEDQIDSDDDDDYRFRECVISDLEVPVQIFSITTLNFLYLRHCNIPQMPVNLHGRPCFPNLETLFLDSVVLDEESLSGFISTSPRLKNLRLLGVECDDEIIISCPTLEKLEIHRISLATIFAVRIVVAPRLRVLHLVCNLQKVNLTGLSDCTELHEIAMFCNPEWYFWIRHQWRELVSVITSARTLLVDYWLLQYLLSDDEDFGSRPPVFPNLRELAICGGPFANSWYLAIVHLLRECPLLEKLELQGYYIDAGGSGLSGRCDYSYIPQNYDFESDDIIQEFKYSTDIVRNLKTLVICDHEGFIYLNKLMNFITSHADKLEKVEISTCSHREETEFEEWIEFNWVSSRVEINIDGHIYILERSD